MEIRFLFILSLLIWIFNSCTREVPSEKDKIVTVENGEVYELANIIQALTEDGLSDPYKIQKGYPYYDSTLQYFAPFMDHPLLDSVNYIREEWMKFLSFRTDAHAWAFDENNKLVRRNEFQSFEIREFDRYVDLIEDFVEVSDYRNYYKQIVPAYDQYIAQYENYYRVKEMKGFLIDEFGDYLNDKKYLSVVSTFVGSQNLQRNIDSLTTASFAQLSKSVILQDDLSEEKQCTDIHTLLSEIDHSYVNPTTDQFEITASFADTLWSDNSGYEDGETSVFNEYLTWATCDIFNDTFFPDVSDHVNLNYHYINEARGFIYSHLFANQLTNLYKEKDKGENIKSLYPKLLEWTKSVEGTLTKPTLVNNSDTLIMSRDQAITCSFSEQMVKADEFGIMVYQPTGDREHRVLNLEKNNISWNAEGTQVTFDLIYPEAEEFYIIFNQYDNPKPSLSSKGVLLKYRSYVIIQVQD